MKTLIIENEEQGETSPLTANPVFGMWKDREDIADATVHARQLRATRYEFDASGSTRLELGDASAGVGLGTAH